MRTVEGGVWKWSRGAEVLGLEGKASLGQRSGDSNRTWQVRGAQGVRRKRGEPPYSEQLPTAG